MGKSASLASGLDSRPRRSARLRRSPYFPESDFGLLQEKYAPDPFRIMMVAIFCTQTPGKRAGPYLSALFEQWPTIASLAQADWREIAAFIKPLGLFNVRAKRIVALAKAFLETPPKPGQTSLRKGHRLYPPTEISHLVGAGPYAMDCYRIFCTPDGWRSCRPDDKELILYVEWRWAKEGINYHEMRRQESYCR
ncbi:hypothetical protein PYCC9005_003298 [Savitreella phatthalungensis]